MGEKTDTPEQKRDMAGKKDLEKSKNREAFLFLVSYIKRHIWGVLSGVSVLIGVDLAQIYMPKIVQKTIDMLGQSAFSNELVVRNMVFMLLLAFGMIPLRFLWRIFLVGASRKIEKGLWYDGLVLKGVPIFPIRF